MHIHEHVCCECGDVHCCCQCRLRVVWEAIEAANGR